MVACDSNKKFDPQNHLLTNEWCKIQLDTGNQMCFTFGENKLIITENGNQVALVSVTMEKSDDSLFVLNVVGEEMKNIVKLLSRDSINMRQINPDGNIGNFIRTNIIKNQ